VLRGVVPIEPVRSLRFAVVDYIHEPLPFKLRKVMRYARLYGPARTLVKVRSQYHMRKGYDRLPPARHASDGRAHVGIIGCGKFAYSHIAYYLTKDFGGVIRGVMDVEIDHAASLFDRYDAEYYTDDVTELLVDPKIDLVFVASNHASHAEYAIAALQQGKNVHIEKPHVVSGEQLDRLCQAMEASDGRVTLGFNRPRSPFGKEIQRVLAAQTGSGMLNWFIAGHEIPADHWYFSEAEGGRVLGNLCHWTDFVYQMVPPDGRYPVTIRPTRAEQADCDLAVTFQFADDTIAAITFSAKGHTFEGVRERFAAHRGDALISLDDFQTLRIDIGARRRTSRLWSRDHGHRANIHNTYGLVRPERVAGEACTVRYVRETGELFLATKESLAQMRPITLEGFTSARSSALAV
jgi:predicted dehydrogenase